MSIKHRVILLLGLLAAMYVLLTTVVVLNGSLPTFTAIEREFAEQNAKRVKQYINSELNRLDNFSIDWAQWTETRDYMIGENPDFMDTSLTSDAPSLINADVLMFVDNDHNIKWGGVFDFYTFEKLPLEKYLDITLPNYDEIYNHRDVLDSTLGLVAGPGPVLMLAARPIVDNDVNGPIAGTLVIGRLLDDRFINNMNNDLALDSRLFDFKNQSSEFRELYVSKFENNSDSAFVVFDTKTQHMVKYDDIYGKPVLLSVVDSELTVTEIGRSALNTGILVLIAALFLFIFAIWVLLEKLVLRPVSQLKDHMHKMVLDENLSQDFAMSRTDEFGEMAREFNTLMAKVKASKQESELARKEAIAASKAKSEFLATMSHEIRTPMNGVLGLADLLLISKPLTPEQEQFGGLIKNSGSALLKILNDILDFSKIEAGKFILEEAEFSMGDMLESVAEIFVYQVQNKGLEFAVDIPTEFSKKFRGDEGRLRQIVSNLLSNAVKFTDSGSICLRATESLFQNSPVIKIEVEDTGIGIKKENQNQLFNSFTQEDASTTRKYGGTGLGLAVTKQLAELMGGEAGLSSTVDIGSKFWVSIPLKADGEELPVTQNQYIDHGAIVLTQQSKCTAVLKRHLDYWGVTALVTESSDLLAETFNVAMQEKKLEEIVVFLDEKFATEKVADLIEKQRSAQVSSKIKLVILNTISNSFPDSALQEYGASFLLNKPVKINAIAESFSRPQSVKKAKNKVVKKLGISEETTSALNGSKVLLVEDNPVNVIVAQKMLEKTGCQVITANNGEEAVMLRKQHVFDVIFMDCAMPVMDGLEATVKIREFERDAGVEPVTVIALTANAMDDYREKCLKSGMNDFLSKPLLLNALVEKLHCTVT